MTSDRPIWVWAVCGLLLLSMLLNYMDRMTLNQLSPTLKKTVLENDNERYAMLDVGFGIGFAVGALIFGWLADRVNLRWLYPVAVGGWSLAGFLTGYTSTYEEMLVCRVALGIFEAGQFPCGLKATQRLLSPERRPFGNSLLQGGGAIGAAITPAAVYFMVGGSLEWQLPFRVLGLVGIFWVVGWMFVVRGDDLQPPPLKQTTGEELWAMVAVWRDPRYWALLGMNLGMNCHWHAYRVWLPLMLDEQHGYQDGQSTVIMSVFYVVSDLVMFGVGAAAWWLTRRGWGVHASRMFLFGLAAGACLLSVGIGLGAKGAVFLTLLPIVGGAGLALFPLYYSFSQELSATHQGKVTGTLSSLNWLGLSVFQKWAGWMTKPSMPGGPSDYGPVILFVAVLPLVSFGVLWLIWPARPLADIPPKSYPDQGARA